MDDTSSEYTDYTSYYGCDCEEAGAANMLPVRWIVKKAFRMDVKPIGIQD